MGKGQLEKQHRARSKRSEEVPLCAVHETSKLEPVTYELLLKVLQTQAEAEKMHGMMEALIHEARQKGIYFGEFIEITKKHFIQQVLADNRGNQSAAAKELHAHRNTVSRWFEELGIETKPRSKKPISSQVAKGMKVSA